MPLLLVILSGAELAPWFFILQMEEGENNVQTATRAVGVKVSSEQCEIEGIIFGLEIAITYFGYNCEKNYGKCVYIFCNCQKVIDTLTVHNELVKRPEGMARHIQDQLNE